VGNNQHKSELGLGLREGERTGIVATSPMPINEQINSGHKVNHRMAENFREMGV
jgi:hypothetical protein